MSDDVRAFLSIEIDDKNLLAQIQTIQLKLDQTAAKMKIVKEGNIHFTLRFFGDTIRPRLDQIKARLDEIDFNQFEIEVAGVGSFPNKRRPRIIWVGVTQNASKVMSLKDEIDSSLIDVGYQPEKREYTPHATIARVRHVKDSRRIADNLESLADAIIGKMNVTRVTMMKSTLTPSGPIYESLWEIR